MKKLALAIIFTTILAAGAQAAPSWQSAVDSAISSGSLSQIDVVAASNPSAQGAIALYLLQQAQAKVATNPALASKLFAEATSFANQISPSNVNAANLIIRAMVEKAASGTLPSAEASSILVSALTMSNQPNMVAGAPTLHDYVLADADGS